MGMAHYFDEKQNSRLALKRYDVNLRGRTFYFFTATGIFSKERLDKGTRILAENMVVGQSDFVLDMGCGAGILGIVAAKLSKGKIVMTDINKRAVSLAKKNVKLNDANNVEIRQGNLFEPIGINERFDVIVVNPPMKAGYKVCFEIIEKARLHLVENGALQLVALHNKGGRRLSERMKAVFGNVSEVAKESGYRVYLSRIVGKAD